MKQKIYLLLVLCCVSLTYVHVNADDETNVQYQSNAGDSDLFAENGASQEDETAQRLIKEEEVNNSNAHDTASAYPAWVQKVGAAVMVKYLTCKSYLAQWWHWLYAQIPTLQAE